MEFAAAAKENKTAVELNLEAILLNPEYPDKFISCYLEYMAELQSLGVQLSIGSDCHNAHYDPDLDKAATMLAGSGIKDNFWKLDPRSCPIRNEI